MAAGLLSISVVAMARLYTSAARGAAANDAMLEAYDVASQSTETFATMDPDDVPACTGTVGCSTAGGSAFAPTPGSLR